MARLALCLALSIAIVLLLLSGPPSFSEALSLRGHSKVSVPKFSLETALISPECPALTDAETAAYNQHISTNGRGTGGLNDCDRKVLIYWASQKKSVFEFGVGESTLLFSSVGVDRLFGVDSSGTWVDDVTGRIPAKYNITWVNVGPVGAFGTPTEPLNHTDGIAEYSSAPFALNQEPYAMYFVDGRVRVACVMKSFLHSVDAVVLLHDFNSRGSNVYKDVFLVADCIGGCCHPPTCSEANLAVLKRKPTVSDADLLELWERYKMVLN